MIQPLSDLPARLRAWPRRRVDLALAAAVVVEAALELAAVDAATGRRVGAVALAAVVGAAVLVRRRHPVAAVAVAFGGIAGYDLLPGGLNNLAAGPFFGLLFVVYSMAWRTEGRRLTAGILLTTVAAVAVELLRGPELSGFAFAGLVVVAAPIVAGQLLQSRVRLNRALREKAERIERDRAARAEEAVAEERARIAGELHDVVAHALGAMTVQAAAARRLAAKDTERAAGAFEAVEATGREALRELRRVLGVLRREDDEEALAPQPRLASVDELVRRVRAAGLPVELAVEGAHAELPRGIDLTAYRVVQEALREALETGGAGHADVRVRYRDDGVEIEVVDDGVHGGGRRLLGMHERVRVYGGQLEAGPRREGGHEVRARLPVEASS